MLRHLISASAAALLPVAACAQTPSGEAPTAEEAASSPECFRGALINGWGVIDNRTIRVDVGARRSFALHTIANARQVRWERAIVVTSPTGWICTGASPGVEIRIGGDIPRTFVVNRVTLLSPAEPGANGQEQQPQQQPPQN